MTWTADQSIDCDVAVVGSGVAGAHTAFALARNKLRVVILEAGRNYSRGDLVATFYANPNKGPQSAYPPDAFAPFPDDGQYDKLYINAKDSNQPFIGAYLRLVGGTSWHWTGFADRLRPADFRMRSRYGVGADWPIRYEDLDRYYEAAELQWGVSGDPGFVWGSPRRTGFPMPPVPPTYLDRVVAPALKKLGLSAGPFIHARNAEQYDGRPSCCGNNTCVPICPIGAKYDASVHVAKAVAFGARLLDRARVDFIAVGKNKAVTALYAKRPDNTVLRITARHYVVCCHAIETPRLLLNSAQETAPNGVANASDNVGRYLLTQANQDTQGLTRDPVFPNRGPQQTSGIEQFRDGSFRRTMAAVGTSFMNSGWSGNMDATKLAKEKIAAGLKGSVLIAELKDEMSRHLRLNSSAETLPDRDNRITLDARNLDSAGIPRPVVRFVLSDYTTRGLAAALKVNQQIFSELGATKVSSNDPYLSNAIIAGTTRMGRDPKDSVVDPNLRTHDHPNLYVVGTGTHVTAPVNAPSLTIAALAYRLADFLTARFGQVPPASPNESGARRQP
jgi:choline dehydrogenase-like flavoprotein